jgi:predicted nucleic acid-binding protein
MCHSYFGWCDTPGHEGFAKNGAQMEDGLADTSVFMALEHSRDLAGTPPERIAVSVVTVGELRLGVLAPVTDRHAPDALKR